MKTLELIPPAAGEGLSMEAMEAHYRARGIQIVWRVPQPTFRRPRMDLTGIESRTCPGCGKDVKRHDQFWRRARLSMGRLGKFMPTCRKCEDTKNGYPCIECKKHHPQSVYRVTSEKNGKQYRSRTCPKCEAKPLEDRTKSCPTCKRPTSRAEIVANKGYCKPCGASYKAAYKRKVKPSTGTCLGCGVVKPAEEFPLGPSGSRRRQHCTACVTAAQTATHAECGRCHHSKPVAQFSPDRNRLSGRRDLCKPCASYVTAYKARRARMVKAVEEMAA